MKEHIVAVTPVIGIVGGVGAGKSAIAHYVADHLAVAIVDGDFVGHEGLRQQEIKERLVQEFGNSILNEQGEIIRGQLGKLVFGDGELQKLNLKKLNQIIHPWMERKFEELFSNYRKENRLKAILFDAAILLDAGWDKYCDKIVYIDVSKKRRETRVNEQRAWSKEMHHQREANQLALVKKKKRADVVILNNGELSEAGEALIFYIKEMLEK